ncbi:MAG: SLC45 family MFS transporter [Candidatus Heimdallarchaeota archaeon]|nr:SLC45 family MFS transporter [Candidatus Heimdallarchaeota archaeon]
MTDTENSIPKYMIPIVALGFASTQLSWALFNIEVPVILEDNYGISLAFVGFIMTWDNIIAFFIQPAIGSYSDKTRTRIGRRMPFIIPGILFGASFFFLLSFSKNEMIAFFLINIVVFNLFMALYRSPSVSLLPDLVKSEDRSLGNGIVNLMGGIAAGLSLAIGGALLKGGETRSAFAFVSIGMVIFLFILVLFIREPKYDEVELASENKEGIFKQLKNEFKRIISSDDKSLLFMLLAILTWFMAWNAIEAFYSIYVWKTYLPDLDAEEAAGEAGGVLFVFPVVFVLFTIVGGLLGGKLGRIKTMRIGLSVMLFAIILAAFVNEDTFLDQDIGWKTSFALIFVIAAIGWGLVNVNSIVVVWEHSPDNGIATGMYYAFASLAAVLGPTMVGVLMDIEIRALFPFSITFLVIAFIFLLNVKTGEAGMKSDLSTGKAIGEMVD